MLPALVAPVLSWVFRAVVIKFVALTAVFAVMFAAIPLAQQFLAPFVSSGPLYSAFSGLPAGVWFFLDFYNLGFGVPLIISAYVARFLIRRLPVIG
jgi:hypothetical protein